MNYNFNRQKGFTYVEMALLISCIFAMLFLANCAMKLQGKISQEESLLRSSTMVNSMPLIFKDAMDKNRKVGKLTPDFWERSEIYPFLHMKNYRDQNNVAWKTVYLATGSIQKEEGEELAITMRGLYFFDCENIQKELGKKKDISNIQVNPDRIEYGKNCQKAPDNVIVYKQKLNVLEK